MSDHEARQTETPIPDHNSQSGKSELACSLCKRRKTKCDRALPTCGPCDRAAQACVYPSKRMKPGPKLGSRLRERRRSRNYESGNRERRGQCKRRRDCTSDIASREYDQASHFAAESAGSHSNAPSALPQSRWSKAVLEDLQSLPPSPTYTDQDDESTSMSDSSEIAATNFVRAISLSSLIHPTHESRHQPPSRATQALPEGFFINLLGAQKLINQACEAMGISVDALQILTDLYIDNMTDLSLFHRPTFGAKIQNITALAPLVALLGSMFSISIKFYPTISPEGGCVDSTGLPSSDKFHQLAVKAIDEALDEAGDEVPSLTVLQAMVLCTFNELMRGVRGKGWRLLGTCVRISYEQHLNLIDYGAPSHPPTNENEIRRWVVKEEQRRCWWAIWEMDVFASTIRRCPLAVDWSMNETYLPVNDDSWFSNTYSRSCFLDLQPGERWKKLKKASVQNSKAWFIVVNSIMRDAQTLTRGNLQGIRSERQDQDETTDLQQYFYNVFRKKSPIVGDQQLYVLSHALQQTISAMPEALAYKGQRLFTSSDGLRAPQFGSTVATETTMDMSRYSIFLMTQLARFQIFHHYAFGEIVSGTLFTENPPDPPFGWTSAPSPSPRNICNFEGLRNCLEAADNIFFILKNVPEWHVKWVSPFLASTIWLAASLQILRKVYTLGKEDEIETKFSLLRLTCQRYSQFWGTPLTLVQNVDSLERHLMHKRDTMAAMEARSEEKRRASKAKWDKPARTCVPADENCGPEARFEETLAGNQLLAMDFMSDLYNSASLACAGGLVGEGNSQSDSSLSTTTNWLSFLPERQCDIEDLSMEYQPELLFPFAGAPESSEMPTKDGELRNGLDQFASEFLSRAQ
ncbi:hypothetical protein FOVSG1_010073 [Fusarium oxysporum f. sp. vasinfectum]